MRAKDNDHYKSGNHTPKHPLQVFPLKTYLPSTFNAQMCALSRQTARTKREKEGGRKNYLNIDVWPLSTVSLAWNVQPGLPAAVAAVSLCARRACKFVQLDAKTNTWNASRSNGHTLVHQFMATCGIFLLILFYSFAYNRKRDSAKRAVCEFWFIRQWQRHLYCICSCCFIFA